MQTDATTPNNVASIWTGLKVWPVSNFAPQDPTTCNGVCKRTQHVTSNNVGSCWPTMLRPFARSLKCTKAHARNCDMRPAHYWLSGLDCPLLCGGGQAEGARKSRKIGGRRKGRRWEFYSRKKKEKWGGGGISQKWIFHEIKRSR